MIDVLFVIPNSSKKAYQGLANHYSTIEPPTWALLLASSVRKKGFESQILDCGALRLDENQAVKEIETLKPRLCCFVLYGQNPNSGTTSMIGAESLSDAIKDSSSNSKIVFVGSHVSALPREVLSKKSIDFVLVNEGVYGLIDLLKTDLNSNLQNCQALGFKKDNEMIFNKVGSLVPLHKMDEDLPGYAWDLLPKKNKALDLYRASYWHTYFSDEDRSPFAAVYSSLGCMFACNFCMINILNRTNNEENADASNFKGMRFWSPDFFLDQLGILQKLGVKTLRLSDEMFFLNKKYYVPILEGIISRGYKFNIWAYARVDTVREDQLELFKKAGVNWLALGIESGNQNVRLSIEKGKFRDINIRDIVNLIKKYDINVLGNYIFGFPDDNHKSLQDTLDLAIELNCEHSNFYACQALPGSPLYTYSKNNNLELPSKYEEYAFLSYDCKPMDTKYLSGSEVLKFRDEAWHKYFSNEKYLSLIESKFGIQNRKNIEEQSKIRLDRKYY